MIYYVLKYTMWIALRLFFRKLYFVGQENIPTKGPVILASMHPNSFVDDFALGAFSKRKLRFLARGDVFKTKAAQFFLEQMCVSPIYRAMDNPQDVKKNIEAFSIYTNTLKKNGTLLIHSEGICIHEKKVRKLKKGTARIAFSAEEENDFKLGVQIVPVSMNYTDAPKTRQDLMVEYSKPILVSDYKDLYLESPSKAILALNEAIYEALNNKAILIEDKENEVFAEQCLELTRNNRFIPTFPIFGHQAQRFIDEQETTKGIKTLFDTQKHDFTTISSQANTYFKQLKELGLTDRVIGKNNNWFIQLILLILASPIFITGYVANCLPIILSRVVTNKVVKTIEFYASVFVGAAWFFMLIYYTILIIVLTSNFGMMGLIVVLTLAITGFFAVLLRDQYLILFGKLRWIKQKLTQSQKLQDLTQQRLNLLNTLRTHNIPCAK